MTTLEKLFKVTVAGQYQDICGYVEKAINEKIDANEIINNALAKAMIYVGDKFGSGELYMPDMLLAAKTMKTAMAVLKPMMKDGKTFTNKGTIIIGSVKGDLHDIGKNLVTIMLKGAGFNVIDLGIDVPAARVIEVAEQEGAAVIGLSALLNTTMSNMSEVVKLLEEKGLHDRIKVLIGGAPVSDDFAREIGADSYGKDAFAAIKEAEKLIVSGGNV